MALCDGAGRPLVPRERSRARFQREYGYTVICCQYGCTEAADTTRVLSDTSTDAPERAQRVLARRRAFALGWLTKMFLPEAASCR